MNDPRARERLSVLLLEDNELDAQLIEANLVEAGLQADVVRVDSKAAFSRALLDCRFDLILSDYNIPGFDGTQALTQARAACPETPFVFVTGALGEERAIELLKRGATDYVLKDRLERLAPSVERALRETHEKAERKRAEEARLESERALQTLMGNMPGMAFRRAPRPPWVFEYASPGAEELSGYRPEELYAGGCTTWAALMHPDDVERVALDADAAFSARQQLTVTYRIRTHGGQEKCVWERSVGVHDEDGALKFIEGFVTDITQQKEAEAQAKSRAEFEQQLIGIVSHDLRNPLHVILLASTTALKQENLDERLTRMLQRIQSSGDRAVRMIRDLLDFTQARLGGGIHVERKHCCLMDLVPQVVDEAETTHPGREVRTHCEGETSGEYDWDRVAQAIENLLVNALRYSPKDTPVTVRVVGDDEVVRVEVHNYGPPISPELRARLFEPMQRGPGAGDRSGRSVGLGLYIVEHIARAHGGHVDVRSSADEGTTFVLRLPRWIQSR